MSEELRVNLKDKYRVLMTELLPYEVPLWFYNEIIYQRVINDPDSLEKVYKNLPRDIQPKNFIPLDYKVKKSTGGTRVLSIIHPIVQKDFCNFYEKYQDLIIYYTNQSRCSLRHPIKIASSFYKRDGLGDVSHQNTGVEDSSINYKNFISFFKYAQFPFLYKYYESYTYNRLEKKFSSMLQVDISKCFHNIYTHSISWAIKSKFIAKRDRNKGGFDQDFDTLMQKSNYSETNGILIGSEVSRIFAEIILQSIDNNIINEMSTNHLAIGEDYEIKRYVDDYFIYFNDSKIKDKIVEIIDNELFHYKMSLNETKTVLKRRPFVTDITASKIRASEFIDNYFEGNRFEKNDEGIALKRLLKRNKKANITITKFKCLVNEYKVGYPSITNYCLAVLDKKIDSFIGKTPKYCLESPDLFLDWLLIDIELVFFLHSMDLRVVTTDKLSRIVLRILNTLEGESTFPKSHFDLVKKKIFDSCIDAIKVSSRTRQETAIESLNLLLLLSKLKRSQKVSAKFLNDYFVDLIDYKSSKTSFYFSWCSLMLYIKNDDFYQDFRCELLIALKKYFNDEKLEFQSTEYFLLWSDSLSCPYIDGSDKLEILKIHGTKNSTRNDFESYIAQYEKLGLCINWNNDNWLEDSIEKKVYRYAYE